VNEEQAEINLTIAKGSGIVFLGMALSKLAALPISIILARYFGANDYGLLTISSTLVGIIASVSVLGMGMGLGRYVPFHRERGEIGEVRRILVFGGKTVLSCSVIAGVMVFFGAEVIAGRIFKDANLAPLIRVLSFSIPMIALVQYATGLFRGLKKLHYILYYGELAGPALRLLFLIIIAFLGLGIFSVAVSQVFVALLTLSIAIVLFKSDAFFAELRASKLKGDVVSFFKYSFPLAIAIIVRFTRRRFDLLLVGAVLAAKDVAIYNIAVSLGLLLNVPLLGVNRILLPVASGLHSEDKEEELAVTYKSVSRWCLVTVLPFLMFILFYAEDIIIFFYGPEFVLGAAPLRIVSVAVGINVATGSFGEYLQAFGRSKIVMAMSIIGSAVSVTCLFVLVPMYGISGAAFSFMISMVVMIVIGIGALISHRIHPFSWQYFLGLFLGISFYSVIFTILQNTIGDQFHIVLTAILFFISLFLYGFLLFSLNIFSQEEKFMILSWMRNRFTANKKSDIAKTL
jgi:O-antigen/teichoic acid export membrane protein